MIKFTKTALVLAAFTTLPLTASAGLFDDDEARRAILDMRTKVAKLEGDLKNLIDTKTDKSATLDIIAQQERMAEDISRLRGQVELLQNSIDVAAKREKDFYADLDARLRKLEPREVTIDGKTAEVDLSEQKAYDTGMQQFKEGDYKGAAVSLDAFVKRYPVSSYAPSAQYFLGSSYYAQGDCKAAILAQQSLVKNYPDSPKAADAMLNIASCQTQLKAVNNAKKTLQELIKNYPDSQAAAAAKQQLKGK
ncbi:tol-pal system protein YbgF [Pseudoduganella sp. RAF53_2]|jgi:tol-pal system protein YbgF|uniref:tol-pal system protein YbgF n=1 Tax=unclassified Pseudoduganella TaxID=2637179 RepID=UPI003F94372A